MDDAIRTGRLVRLLAERGSLRPNLTVEDGGDILWTLCSLAVHDKVVLERGWTAARYETWLASTLKGVLLA